MLSNIRTKIRALVEDFSQKDVESFTYQSGDTIFILAEENILSIIKVTKNGIELGTGDYSYDSSTSELEITIALIRGDIIIVKYIYSKYSDTELNGYIRAGLVWISTHSHESEIDYEIEDNRIVPTPNNKTIDLIALVSAILIKPDYSEYRLPNITVRYPRTMTKEEKIERLIGKYYYGIGVINI